MRTNYIKQAYAHLRQDPITAVVIIVGTALSIFLIMLVIILQQIRIVPYAPESNRDRMLSANLTGYYTNNGSNVSACAINETTFNRLYKSLKTPQAVSMYSVILPSVISAPGIRPYNVDTKATDEVYWKIFDFKFISGKPYDKLTLNSRKAEAVICESVAKKLFGYTNVTGKEMSIDHKTFKITGVVKDVSTLTPRAYSCIWIPYKTIPQETSSAAIINGIYSVIILAHKADDFKKIKKEFRKKVDLINNDSAFKKADIQIYKWGLESIKEENSGIINSEMYFFLRYSYWNKPIIIIIIIILIPAINLSCTTQSKLRRRIAEIGIRRAFGCTRTTILYNIIIENFILSLLGAIIAIAFSILFILFGAKFLFTHGIETFTDPIITLPMLLNCHIVVYAFVFCFILNLLCSLVPAWRASRYNIIDAINGRTH